MMATMTMMMMTTTPAATRSVAVVESIPRARSLPYPFRFLEFENRSLPLLFILY
jgi:hypothetical protein